MGNMFNPDFNSTKPPVATESKVDTRLLKSAIFSLGGKVTKDDVLKMIDDGILTTEDARDVIAKMEASTIKVDKEMRRLALHRQACLILARNAGDATYKKLTDNYLEREKLFNQLDAKYGQQATINQATLLQEIDKTISTESTKVAFREYR